MIDSPWSWGIDYVRAFYDSVCVSLISNISNKHREEFGKAYAKLAIY